MSIFKKKIQFSQFVCDLIAQQMEFLEKDYNKLTVLADEGKVLEANQKEAILDKANELIIADIMLGCGRHFCNKITDEGVGEVITIAYGQYLKECKNLQIELIETKFNKLSEFLNLVSQAEEKMDENKRHYEKLGLEPSYNIDNVNDKMKLCICQAFKEYFLKNIIKTEHNEMAGFAAFKFAMAFILADIVKKAKQYYSIKF